MKRTGRGYWAVAAASIAVILAACAAGLGTQDGDGIRIGGDDLGRSFADTGFQPG